MSLLSGADLFQRLADGAPVMIWMSGLDMGCFYFNRAWLDFVGRTLDQESGNGWADGVHPEDLERCVNHYVSCFQRRIPFAMSYRVRNRLGDYRWILDRGAPHFSPDGRFLGYFGGCAELEQVDVLGRHAALGESLQKMRAFAQVKAASQGEPAAQTETLESAVRRLLVFHAADRLELEHAAAAMKQLAQDMTIYGQIAPGACL